MKPYRAVDFDIEDAMKIVNENNIAFYGAPYIVLIKT